jgi:hypothetical protein
VVDRLEIVSQLMPGLVATAIADQAQLERVGHRVSGDWELEPDLDTVLDKTLVKVQFSTIPPGQCEHEQLPSGPVGELSRRELRRLCTGLAFGRPCSDKCNPHSLPPAEGVLNRQLETLRAVFDRARSHCCFAVSLICIILRLQTHSIVLSLKRRCDLTPGAHGARV